MRSTSNANSIHDSTLEMNMRTKWTHIKNKNSVDDYITSALVPFFLSISYTPCYLPRMKAHIVVFGFKDNQQNA